MLYWIVLIAIVSVFLAFVSLKKEKNKRELNEVKKEMAKGKVIFHSSDASDSSS